MKSSISQIEKDHSNNKSLRRLLQLFRNEIFENKMNVQIQPSQKIGKQRYRSLSNNLPSIFQFKNCQKQNKSQLQVNLLPTISFKQFDFADVEIPIRNNNRNTKQQCQLRNKK